ncbi:hypothetical protein Pres01_42420 [Metapseudomonas resinovorans]|nr:hypothetical protein Pres01_42420 [Pseudomonas resinovorans]
MKHGRMHLINWLLHALDKILSTERVSAFFGALIDGGFAVWATYRPPQPGCKSGRQTQKTGRS